MRVPAKVVTAARKAWGFLIGEHDVAHDALAHVLEDNFDGHIIIGENGRIIAASRVATSMLLGDASTLLGREAGDVLPTSILKVVQQAFADGRRAVPSPMSPATIGDPALGGYIVQFVATLSELGNRGALPRRVVSLTFWDETDRRRREEELTFIGTHDQLTGALTRSEFLKTIDAALEGDRRRADGLTVAVIDLRRFKVVNGVLGPAYGDRLLKLVVSRLKAAGVGTVGRLGGDTFGLMRPGRWQRDEAQTLGNALIDRITVPYAVSGHRVVIGASLGITHTDISGFDAPTLLSHAELALATMDESPRNGVVLFTAEMDRRLKDRQTMHRALRMARERSQFSLTYQPQCSLETGELVGVEALLRWEHPDLGIIPPARFLPAADESGEMIEIGRWYFQNACRDAASWPFKTRLALSVSAVQLEFGDIVADIRDALAQSGIPPQRLDIEVAESLLHSAAAAERLQMLRQLGVAVVLTGFGSGQSGLGQLGGMPVDGIRIDQRFVANLPADPEAGAVIRAVMTLSETIGKVVIADGVETRDQAWMLRMMGCRTGQGHHFGAPRSSRRIAEWFSGPRSGNTGSAVAG